MLVGPFGRISGYALKKHFHERSAKAAYVAVDECSVVGNLEFAPNYRVREGPCLVPHLRRSHGTLHGEIEPQPFRAGLTFSGRPSMPRIHGDFAVSFLSQLAVRQIGCSG